MNDWGFGGRLLLRRSVGAIHLSETRYRPDARMETHAHPTAYFCVVRGGGFQESLRHLSRDYRRGDVIFHPAGEEHADRFSEHGARCFNVELDSSVLSGLPSRPVTEELSRSPLRQLFGLLHRELVSNTPSPLAIEGLVYQALGETFERGPDASRRITWVDAVRTDVEKRFDQPLPLSELALAAGVHPIHLTRAFRQRHGMTIPQYVRQLRVDSARRLLKNSSLSLADIAAAVGFADQSHLTRVFKRLTGLTPGQYRRTIL